MGFWKTFFGAEASPEEEEKSARQKNFDLLKYDGVKALRMGQAEYAVKCFREALKTADDLEVRDYLQQALVRQGLLDEALTELKALAERQPDNVQVLLQAAHVAYMNEDYTAMDALCRQAEAVDPDNAMVQLMKARVALGTGEKVQAIASLTRAVALDEHLGDARLLRAQTLYNMGQLDAVADDVDWLEAHVEPNEDVLLLHARLAHAQGHDDEAVALYGQVIDVNPFQAAAYLERGRLRYEQGDKDGAEADMQHVLELNPAEMEGMSGSFEAEGIEQQTRRAYSNLNPFGI